MGGAFESQLIANLLSRFRGVMQVTFRFKDDAVMDEHGRRRIITDPEEISQRFRRFIQRISVKTHVVLLLIMLFNQQVELADDIKFTVRKPLTRTGLYFRHSRALDDEAFEQCS